MNDDLYRYYSSDPSYRESLPCGECGKVGGCEHFPSERDEHSASRRVDVLQREAPHLLAQPDEPRPSALRIVVNMESDEPELLGTWQETDDCVVWYTTSDGHYRQAPLDCVRIVRVAL